MDREKLLLLDEVLDRFMPDKEDRDLYRDRVTASRIFPTQIVTDLVPAPTRIPSTRDFLPGEPNSPRTEGSTALPPPLNMGSPCVGHEQPERSSRAAISDSGGSAACAMPSSFIAGKSRTKRVRDGKALLEATISSAAPTFREAIPLQLSPLGDEKHDSPTDDSHDDDEGTVHRDVKGGFLQHIAAIGADEDTPVGEAGVSHDGGGGSGGYAKCGRQSGSRQGNDLPSAKNETFAIDLMMTLNSDSLSTLKQQFAQFGDELDVVQFVSVMQEHLPRGVSRRERIRLIANLSELFAQVDVNGDERMEWDELTSFIVEEQRSNGVGEAPPPKYRQVSPLIDQNRIRSEQSIEKVYYVSALDVLVLCESPAPLVSIYRPKTVDCLHELKGHKAEVLALEHIEEAGCLVTSGADLALCWWDVASTTAPSWRLRQRASLQHSQLSLCWCASRGCLFTGGAEGMVCVWDVCALEVTHRLIGHEDAVTDMIIMRMRKELLATASLDRTIRLWDTKGGPPRCCHCLGPPKIGLVPPFGQQPNNYSSTNPSYHERGVTCLAFSSTHKHLFSGGCDHQLLVWNPLSEKIICNLRQHTAPLANVQAVHRAAQVISADLAGSVCIWDTRSLACSQKLSIPVGPGQELTSMSLLPAHRQIVVACRRLSCFEGPQEPEPELTDSAPILAGLFNAKSCTLCTASGSSVMIWDATSGTLVRTIRELFSTSITAMCFDDRERKLIVADHAGSIKVLNYSNGAVMKSMVSHAAEVSCLH